jgi:hypothetical protein
MADNLEVSSRARQVVFDPPEVGIIEMTKVSEEKPILPKLK